MLAVEHLELARRISPVDSLRNIAFRGRAYFMNGGYSEAEQVWTTVSRKFPVYSPAAFVILAATYVMLDRPAEAAATMAKLAEAFPDFRLTRKAVQLGHCKLEEDRNRLYDAARRAGIAEAATGG